MNELKHKIEAILFIKNEPISLSYLLKLTGATKDEIMDAIDTLREEYKNRGVVIVSNNDDYMFGTNPQLSSFIELVHKDEISRELGKAGLETLAVILYKGPVTRREVDRIRGVNSTSIIRSLLLRGLIEKIEQRDGVSSGKSIEYGPTIKLLMHLGISKIEELPNYKDSLNKIDDFMNNHEPEIENE